VRPGRRLAGACLLAVVLPNAPAAAQTAGSVECRRDLLVADSTLRRATDRLVQGGDSAEARCAAWREHVEALRRVSATHRRCTQNPSETIKGVEARAAEFQSLVRDRCRR